MIENEGPQEQLPRQGKLVLPAYPEEELPAYTNAQAAGPNSSGPYQPYPYKAGPAPKKTLTKIGYYWRKDPAYKVLMIATVILIIAGFIFVSLATAAFLRNPNLFGSSNTTPQNPTGPSSGGVDLRPTFPTPGGGSGGNTSSQPPLQSTPALPATATPGGTPTPQPSPTPGSGGSLTVAITSIPAQVSDNSTVPVGVMTNEAGATVRLQVNYNAYPYYYTSEAQVTDQNGNATLYWNVQVSTVRFRHVIAKVVAVATDQNGQFATSSTSIVDVIVGFGQAIAMREQDNGEDLVA